MARNLSTLALLVLLSPATALATPPPTLRVDLVHYGGRGTEGFAVERVLVEPLPWPGHPERRVDDTNLGKYRFVVTDPATGQVLYSRGSSPVYGEWETTAEAAAKTRAFGESLRFPLPAGEVRVAIEKRDAANAFRELWATTVDPADPLIDRAAPPPAGEPIVLFESGPPPVKVDLLLLGDGYPAAERGKCEADARRLTDALFEVEPYRSRRVDFNVRALCPEARESGISRPSLGIHRRSPAGTTYDAFGAERYVLSFDNRAWRDLAAQAPYDIVVIVVNGRTYGGGGIFGEYATVAADSLWAPYIVVHELGHHFAALADEYYTSPAVYEPATERREPWEPNVTALLDPAALKWADLLTPGTPVPTPWEKEAFDTRAREIQAERQRLREARRPEAEMDALFLRQRDEEEARLGAERHAGAVGAFEGANYEATGYYRPAADCIMFTRDRVPFCPVCRRAIERVIDLYAAPLEGGSPP
ncbi:MAG TPA: M64 family metallopeptidase [Thermoanaerobaculia bacterium]|nr:peptidase M64 [Thermoanaerobaculia bacterium]OQC41409.1 MAG: IgA Peptidase M64 [Acidobacteria bacterium ADurb.Bin051]MBP7812899.1 peptidase M64 [Thermoanaerobaculia bacterium]MBP8845615.1 peptidase M64 [Thermoanaerobaculia bacterium]HNZ96985.1 M64 family metallopeptidase [Thermoanaerobaculia bacterium]